MLTLKQAEVQSRRENRHKHGRTLTAGLTDGQPWYYSNRFSPQNLDNKEKYSTSRDSDLLRHNHGVAETDGHDGETVVF